jgi:hypothetical protein
MLWLRESRFEPGRSPITCVIAADGLKEDVHIAADRDRRLFGRIVDVEIFEWPDDMMSATLEAARRAKTRLPEKTHLMDTLHDHLVSTFLRAPRPAMVAPRSVTPLDAVDIRQVLLAASRHPSSKGHVVALRSKDGKEILLKEGEIQVREQP